MEMLDTQIISYAFNGNNDIDVNNKFISSITAKEFLELKPISSTKSNYYIPIVSRWHPSDYLIRYIKKRNQEMHNRHSDYILLQLDNNYGTVKEYCDFAISQIVNNRNTELFRASILKLPRKKQDLLRKRLQFLIDNNIKSLALNLNSVELGLSFFGEFVEHHNIKGNFRNTLYDMLIFATAVDYRCKMITKDKELKRFAERKLINENTNTIIYDFTGEEKLNKESKGYINHGWRIHLSRRNL